jgi:para-nitrobenzyl esterase
MKIGSDPNFLDPNFLDRRGFIGAAGMTAAGLLLGAPTAGAQDIRGRALTREVATTAGRIRGVVLDGEIQAFYGVPYGASTAGANRFMPPKPPASWRGVRDTISVGGRSPQPLAGAPVPEIFALYRANPRGEDCLHVNVSTPALDNKARPVMVWFHGGGFYSGSGDWLLYDGANLARSQDVVVVTVTHRLGIFGFLHLPAIGGGKYADSSNIGMRDMLLALDWVRDNIASFGGDPGLVTLFGQSGGGGKVSVLTAMPGAQRRYHRGIIMSGSTLEVSTADAASEAAGKFVAGTGARDIDALQRMPWEELEAHAERMGF